MLSMNDIRKCFLNFFQSKGHEIVRSSSLIPRDDPSLLFTNAGMVQFKKVFQGLEKKDYTCATTSQKCLRVGGKHNDLENVGRTARHHTFFEMLGNFSFGSYFKKDAICYAWEFLTKELKLPKERLYATVYLDDDEAFDLWIKYTDIPANRIFRMGEKDNFWSMGDTGPCGPCSEILIDQGEHMSCGSNCGIGKCDCDRFLEIWNLVFMQFNQTNTGTREKLANPCIDTGMGLERITAVCQGVYSNYDSDLFRKIIDYSCSLAQVTYSESVPDTNETDTALRVIADHSRSIAFMIADGIMPSNEGRGYVLRRLIRRAYRFGISIGMPSTFIFLTASNIVDLMGESFPELVSNKDFMMRLIKEEEERFEKTLDKGLQLLENEIQLAKRTGSNKLSGDVTFKLYDTYGFPIDIVNDVCAKQSMNVDEESFHAFMAEQKQRAKASWKGSGEIDITTRFTALLEDGLSTTFIGYTQLKAESRIIALLSFEGESVGVLKKGEKGYLVTGCTPFYGASGGQESDTGIVESDLGKADVTDVIKVSDKLTVQAITVTKGEILLDASVCLYVTTENRLATARNHTCTHLLQAALQSVVGSHIHQAGSLVTKDRLRFDFTHMSALTSEEIIEIEKRVNDTIMKDILVQVKEMDYESAVASGATALFGEKYSNVVRVISVEGVSSELCGGTHLDRTGQAGTFIILSESGVAAGVRRIEAITGWNTLNYFNEQRKELVETHRLLKSKSGKLPERVEALQTELREAKKNFEKISSQIASGQGKTLISSIETINDTPVLIANVSATSVKILREIMDDLRSKISSGVICLGSIIDSKPTLLVFVSKNLHGRFTAPSIIKEIAVGIQGSGGGRPDMAQAGGAKPEGIEESFMLLKNLIMKSSH